MTELLAQIFGIYMLVAGLALFMRPLWAGEILQSIKDQAALTYFMGAVILMGGSAIVLTHNIWRGWPEIAVTLIGWAAAIEGALFMLFPKALINWSEKLLVSSTLIRGFSILTLAFGAALLWL